MADMAMRLTNYAVDKDYYFEDGSLAVLVEGCLFKIHRTLFERDSPFFRSLLSLPQGQGVNAPEGQSDENPVICPDSAEDFRALCWVVYSRPLEVLQQQEANTIKVSELIRVVTISHKYEFAAYCEWAWKVLDTYYLAHPANFFDKCGSWPEVRRLFNLAIACEKKTFLDRMEQTWFHKISSSPLGGAIAFKEALNVAEGSDLLREFHAKSYYVYLQSSGIFEAPSQGTTPINLDRVGSWQGLDYSLVGLSDERKIRLLTGFWSLSRLRVRLSQPPKLMDNPSCQKHSSVCVPGWESWWKDVLNKAVGVGDPGKLIELVSDASNQNIGPSRPPNPVSSIKCIPCNMLVRSTIGTLKKNFDDSLAKRFRIL
ncbi:hypothetical protein AGABI1DRAFT_128676 [Agaricus bisporus var. burnettii JB137-S8]|uniref:BTB domain-containing protein n=1 Tax=Agaricus bisporus var. burnettii (strain JB137-S8 / ATCC MYA-4627 / FGSC 10392) TaxID=597362 RepID=K5X8I5_AGABU|nr:uncharacterized protein AGABI1DRAFT_128676 [Agaricus bisporus var. burnettii JB137-S8]EKM79528.1 hypothetical protein AGABI1DRAFT_128676 [Agaricus bisporus var. burnettii JB137-S8]